MEEQQVNDAQQQPTITPELLRSLPTETGYQYTPQQRWDAVLAWSISGNARKAEAICGVPAGTINYWAANADWWPLVLDRIHKLQGSELDAKFTGAIDKTINYIMQALDNTNISVRDAAVTLAILYDKRALSRGMATSRVERVNLTDLRNQFSQVIDAQPISNKVDSQTPSPVDSTG